MRTEIKRSAFSARLAAFALIVVLMSVCICAQSTEGNNRPIVLLTDGTTIHLILMDDLQGKKLHRQDVVHFKVRQDLLVEGKLLVKTGTDAIGHIESVSKSGLLGKSGRMILQIDAVNSTLGTKILLRGGAGVNGGKGGALTTLSSTWYGPDASLPAGTLINAYVNSDQRILVP